MSTSISRGPFGNVLERPTARSMSFTASRRAAADPLQTISTAAFQNSGWSVYPTGSDR